MILTRARLKGFKSFKGEQTFFFPEGPGLYFMRGVNEQEPRLGGNGVGKTTLWDALCWVLFDKTVKGLRAGDVCNWELDREVEVEFDFYFEEQPACLWTIKRTWKPNTWTLSNVAEFVTDEEVVDLTKDESNPTLAAVRLEFTAFLRTILMAQGCDMFLDMKGEAQASLFSNVLGLERWVDYAARASKAAGLQDVKTRELERQLSRLQGEMAALNGQDLSEDLERWERKHKERVAELGEQHDRGMQKRKELKRELADAEEAELNARALVAKSQPDAGLAEGLGVFRGYVSDYSDLLRDAERDLQHALKHYDDLITKQACPTCGATPRKSDLQELIWKGERKRDAVSKEVKRWRKELEASRSRLDELEAEHAEEVTILEGARELLDSAQRAVTGARRALELQERELDRLEDEAERLEGEENPFAGMAQEARQKLQDLREAVRTAQDRVDASYERHGLLSYWAKGFKEIRLQEIGEALTELEIEVNSAVTALGLVDWELRFQVDKEGKGGSITRGFNVMVKSPHNPRPTPWESWSGGEAQRLRLAANMGLADLIRSRTGMSLNVEVWDEPTNGLSPEGIQDLLESLAQRAQNERRQIWIVDHRAFNFGGFAGEATVIKRPSGSTVRTTWGET